MRSGKALLILVVWLIPLLASAGMPNLPPAAVVILDCAFSSITCNGDVTNFYQAGQIMTDLSAPESPPSIYRYRRGPSDLSGGTQLDYFLSSPADELYVGVATRSSVGWRGLDSGSNKLVMVGNAEDNYTLGLYGQAGSNNFHLFWNNQNSGIVNNCHYATRFLSGGAVANGPVYGDCPGGLNWFSNVSTGAWQHGPWHYAEWCGRSSSTTTSRDGVFKWFLDGRIVGNYTQVNTSSPYRRVTITPTWDGQGTPWGLEAYWDMDRWVIARLPAGTCASLGGGAVTPPPPSPTPPSPTPPSPTPPPPSGTPGTVSNLTVVPQSSTMALASFTQQDDGTGVAAKYDNRLAVSPINWGAASSISSGPCASAFAPSGLIGSIVTCLLSGLTPGQAYQMQNVALRGTMNQGATYGSLGNVASFTMPSSNVPVITNFAPASGVSGVSVTLTGSNFGATIGANTVKCNGQTAVVTAASPTSLTFTVPDGVTTGKISVQTDQGIVYSDQNFTVGSGGGCGCS